MATEYLCFGPTFIQTATGTNNAFELLGQSEGDTRIVIDYRTRHVRSDLSGEAPGEVQQMGVSARIRTRLIAVDRAVLSRVLRRAAASGAEAEGIPGFPGTLMGTAGNAHGLYIPSLNDDPWWFHTAMLEQPNRPIGTEAKAVELDFFAWRFVPGSATTILNTYKLYTRSAPS